MTMQQKRAALASFVRARLDGHGHPFRVEQHAIKDVMRARTHGDRAQVMGDPIRYAVVEHVGAVDVPVLLADNTAGLVAHTFVVGVWMGLDPSNAYETSSQAAWDALIEGEDPPGLLPALRGLRVLEDGSAMAQVNLPAESDVRVVAMGNQQDGHFAHRLGFTITLT